jgi:hypothetical protein
MLTRLRRMIAHLFGWGPPPGGRADPYAGVRQPRSPAPQGRAGAVAVEEPRSDHATRAVGRSLR